jgi:hypothetical protein
MATAYNRKSVPETLIRKIGALPVARIAEVEDFVDFIGQREGEAASDAALSAAAMTASASAFASARRLLFTGHSVTGLREVRHPARLGATSPTSCQVRTGTGFWNGQLQTSRFGGWLQNW